MAKEIHKALDATTGKPIAGVLGYQNGNLVAITDKNGVWQDYKGIKEGGKQMAEKKEKETRPYSPEQLVEVLERIAAALERIAGRLDQNLQRPYTTKWQDELTRLRMKDMER